MLYKRIWRRRNVCQRYGSVQLHAFVVTCWGRTNLWLKYNMCFKRSALFFPITHRVFMFMPQVDHRQIWSVLMGSFQKMSSKGVWNKTSFEALYLLFAIFMLLLLKGRSLEWATCLGQLQVGLYAPSDACNPSSWRVPAWWATCSVTKLEFRNLSYNTFCRHRLEHELPVQHRRSFVFRAMHIKLFRQ